MRGDVEGAGGIGDGLARKPAVLALNILQNFEHGLRLVFMPFGNFKDFGGDGFVYDGFVSHGSSYPSAQELIVATPAIIILSSCSQMVTLTIHYSQGRLSLFDVTIFANKKKQPSV